MAKPETETSAFDILSVMNQKSRTRPVAEIKRALRERAMQAAIHAAAQAMTNPVLVNGEQLAPTASEAGSVLKALVNKLTGASVTTDEAVSLIESLKGK